MAFAAFPSSETRPSALALNIVAATYSTWVFNRNRVVDWQKLRPLLLSSIPTALVGGFIVLDESVYKTTTGVVLLLQSCAVTPLVLRIERPRSGAPRPVGAVVGLVSGLTGGGGGVFWRRRSSRCIGRHQNRQLLYQPPSSWRIPRSV